MIAAPYIIDILLIVTFVIGLFNYKKYKNTYAKYFLFFLAYGLLTEFLGYFYAVLFRKPNHIFFNIYTLVQYFFFFWLLSKYFKNALNKKAVKIFTILVSLAFIINSLFFQSIFKVSQSYFFLFGDTLFIIAIILFFIEILNGDAILKIRNLLIFWAVAGALLFELGYIPVYLTYKYINYVNGPTYGYIILFLNIISCSCYSFGFIASKKGVDY